MVLPRMERGSSTVLKSCTIWFSEMAPTRRVPAYTGSWETPFFFIRLTLSEIVALDWTEMTGFDMTSEAFLPSIRICDLRASEIDFIVLNEGSTRPDSSL